MEPRGGIKGEDGAGAGKPLADGATTGGMKIDGAPKAVLMESPLGGKTPVAPAIPIEQPVKLAPLAVPGTPFRRRRWLPLSSHRSRC